MTLNNPLIDETQVAPPTAILDTCVLFPLLLRDTLIFAYDFGLYRMHYSDIILDELQRNLLDNSKIKREAAQKIVSGIKNTYPEAVVKVSQRLIPCMTNNEKDRHVLAAALIAKAQIIVTNNLKDFQSTDLSEFNVIAQSPDDFLVRLQYSNPVIMSDTLNAQVGRYRKKINTIQDLLHRLETSVPKFVETMKLYYEYSN